MAMAAINPSAQVKITASLADAVGEENELLKAAEELDIDLAPKTGFAKKFAATKEQLGQEKVGEATALTNEGVTDTASEPTIDAYASGFMFQANQAIPEGTEPFFMDFQLIDVDQYVITGGRSGVLTREEVKTLRRNLKKVLKKEKMDYPENFPPKDKDDYGDAADIDVYTGEVDITYSDYKKMQNLPWMKSKKKKWQKEWMKKVDKEFNETFPDIPVDVVGEAAQPGLYYAKEAGEILASMSGPPTPKGYYPPGVTVEPKEILNADNEVIGLAIKQPNGTWTLVNADPTS